ncbi:ribonuclease E/G [Candidatus Gromoviella agglomerans]|uniref:ribonuclease E/G n=1 Tax=Candidatus Gromoviella agglomerans TaxID=2806609 RepID=UPI001E54AC44|nr:ribonuclease E/G [Candidatus Gromoviella agglomerans]UFX98186.1 Rne/Rng family ribonuclease [Candidatus Gromoviella agglomerans]
MNINKDQEILIDALIENETKILIKNNENNVLRFFVDNNYKHSLNGNIYLARVKQINQKINAIFLDFGLKKHGLMRLTDIKNAYVLQKNTKMVVGDFVIVQVQKEPREEKGAHLSGNISISSKYCILMPQNPNLFGISKKIKGNVAREKIKTLFQNEKKDYGIIVRTTAVNAQIQEILDDYKNVRNTWESIKNEVHRMVSACKDDFSKIEPKILYEESNIIKTCMRDYCKNETSKIIIQADKSRYKTIKKEIEDYLKSYCPPIERIESDIFEKYLVHKDIETFYSQNVITSSGVKIIIQITHTCVTIDVNSYKSNINSASQINEEAANEIGKQIICRNLSGIIIIDFIDINRTKQTQNIKKILEKSMEHDDRNVDIYHVEELNIICISRERVGNSLAELTLEQCDECNGSGYKKSSESSALELIRETLFVANNLEIDESKFISSSLLTLNVLINDHNFLDDIKRKYNLSISIQLVNDIGIFIKKNKPKTLIQGIFSKIKNVASKIH